MLNIKKLSCYAACITVGVSLSMIYTKYEVNRVNQKEQTNVVLNTELESIKLAHSLLTTFEGYKSKCYKDNKGKVAIGHGFTTDKPINCQISEHESTMRLWLHVMELSEFLDKTVEVPMTISQKASLISFVFNIGKTAFINSEVLYQIQNENWLQAKYEMLEWSVKNPKYKNGVAKRRTIEANLLA